MDIFWLFLGSFLLIIGFIGSFTPLPGAPLSFIGILILNYFHLISISSNELYTLGFLTLLVAFADYFIPIWGTKKLGGSKLGARGSFIGILIGLLGGPFGVIIGAFLGSFLGEIINKPDIQIALKAAIGSLLGFIAGVIIQIMLCGYMLYLAITNYVN